MWNVVEAAPAGFKDFGFLLEVISKAIQVWKLKRASRSLLRQVWKVVVSLQRGVEILKINFFVSVCLKSRSQGTPQGPLFDPFWGLLGASWGAFWALLASLGPLLGLHGPLWASIGLPWGITAASLGCFGSLRRSREVPNGHILETMHRFYKFYACLLSVFSFFICFLLRVETYLSKN